MQLAYRLRNSDPDSGTDSGTVPDTNSGTDSGTDSGTVPGTDSDPGTPTPKRRHQTALEADVYLSR